MHPHAHPICRRGAAGPRLLNYCAWLTAVSGVLLVGLGGLVTSHGVGMAVPDWPTTYGYNMFLFPVKFWTGGVLYEHTHRLFASAVGLLTFGLALWLYKVEPRRWVRRLGIIAALAVTAQGVLGGFRVIFNQHGWGTELGILHGTVAQVFLALLGTIALVTTRWWRKVEAGETSLAGWAPMRGAFLGAAVAIFAQLLLGATMRHQHAGLAVPDFPLAYGRIWPRTDAAFLEAVNQHRVDARDFAPVTAEQVVLHMAHRLGAVLVLGAVLHCVWRAVREAKARRGPVGWCWAWLGAVLVQGTLGAFTVWKNKPADLATLHVVVGAVIFMMGVLFWVVARRGARQARAHPSPRAGSIDLAAPVGAAAATAQ